MCGIAGKIYFDKNKSVTEVEIKKMTDAISHRGPDDEGFVLDRNIGLGHRRLSIIDLSAKGHQPMSDDKGKVWIVFNGEIYNFLELRKNLEKENIVFKSGTDTEVIIYLYKKYGTGCLEYLRGMFAFAIWDSENKQIFIARDRLGKKPLKYYLDRNCFIFASELKAILQNKEVPKEPDLDAIDEFLTYKYVPCPKTGFKNIYKLPPAHFALIRENGKMEIQKYWTLDYSKKNHLSEKGWEQKIIEKLQESIRLRMVSDVPLGAHLSGGIDSSLIVALMAEESAKKIKTFSIGFKEKTFNELPFARLIAKKYNTEHHEFIIEPNAIEILPEIIYHYEEPYADASALPTWYLSKTTREQVTVALNGDGGDENFAGYERYAAMKLHRILKFIPLGIIKQLAKKSQKMSSINFLGKLHRLASTQSGSAFDTYLNILQYFSPFEKNLLHTEKFKDSITNSSWKKFSKKYFDEAGNFGWLDRLLYTGVNTHLPDDLLVKVDIASMAHALEIRSPLLDHEFMELAAGIPERLKMKGFNKKYILKQIALKYLPKECVMRPKKGFTVPLEFWFKGELNEYLKENLLDKKFFEYNLFNKSRIEEIIHGPRKDNYNNTNHLWTLLCLRLWLKTWFE